MNGDGLADLLISAQTRSPYGESEAGESYVIFARADGFAAEFNLSDRYGESTLNGRNGFQIDGEAAYDRSGSSIASAGDVNGDGFDDVIIGAAGADPRGSSSGAAYVVFGGQTFVRGRLNLSSLNGASGFQINGDASYDLAGSSVSSAGDVKGDGLDDLIVGASGADRNGSSSGAAYVVFGKTGGFASELNPRTLDGRSGFRISGERADDHLGPVGSAGDVNGDGVDDLIVGARGADPNGSGSGAAYVVFGRSGVFSANLELSDLNGTNGFQISGEEGGDAFGASVTSAGDVNGDGFDDLLIEAPYADQNGQSGIAYVVFGKAKGFASEVDLSSLNGRNRF